MSYPKQVIETMVARTDGVPLFIEELTTAVVEAGTTAGARDIPATHADSLMARLDRLGAAKEVAQVGAVIGRARHCEAAGLIDKAISYYQRAGERAQERSAYEEAIGHLRNAIALLGTLPVGPERDAREVAGQLALGASLNVVRGPAHAEPVAAYERARMLCEALGDASTLASALLALAGVYIGRGEPDRGLLLAERVLAVGEETRDRTLILLGHSSVAQAQYFQGRFSDSLAHAERAIALYDPTCDRGKGLLWGADPGVAALGFAAGNLAALGHADRALGRAREGVARARTCRPSAGYRGMPCCAVVW